MKYWKQIVKKIVLVIFGVTVVVILLVKGMQLPYNHAMTSVRLLTTGDTTCVYVPIISGSHDIGDTIFISSSLGNNQVEENAWYYDSDYVSGMSLDTVYEDNFGGWQRIVAARIIKK